MIAFDRCAERLGVNSISIRRATVFSVLYTIVNPTAWWMYVGIWGAPVWGLFESMRFPGILYVLIWTLPAMLIYSWIQRDQVRLRWRHFLVIALFCTIGQAALHGVTLPVWLRPEPHLPKRVESSVQLLKATLLFFLPVSILTAKLSHHTTRILFACAYQMRRSRRWCLSMPR